MARDVTTIKQAIIDQKNATAELNGLNSTSQTAIWNLWAFIVASAINLHEQLWDAFKVVLELLVLKAVPGTPLWYQDQIFKFQYDAVSPQIIQLINFYPIYPTVDATKRIVTQCAITQVGRVVNIKAAKGVVPAFSALAPDELSALQSYVAKIKFAGTSTNTISLNSDKLKVAVDVYYDGQYVQATVKAAVKTAIQAFLAALPFDGSMSLQKLDDAIQAVPGVTDLVLTSVIGRPDVIPLPSGLVTVLVAASQELAKSYSSSAGYIVSETTAGSTLDDTINMILS